MPPRKKQKRNITGLRNQQPTSSAPSIGSNDPGDTLDDDSTMGVHFDSLRVDWENEGESDIESEVDLDEFDDEEFTLRLADMAEKEDLKDPDWLPPSLQVKFRERKERPKHYDTTADSMNKAQSSAYRHAAQFR
ncbi:hypothetical protein B0H14DRAFT_3128725, partial [Mycena olivaceomarginata]